MMRCLAGVLGSLLLLSPITAAAGKKVFTPDIARVAPVIGEHYEMILLKAGEPENRFKRSRQLAESLTPFERINPFEKLDELVGWLGVAAMVESAVASADEVPEEWERELLVLYRDFASAEVNLKAFRSAMAIMALQPGAEAHPAVKIANQLAAVVPYAREGIRWIASRRLARSPGKLLRKEILQGLVVVNRREGDYQGMHMAAATLCDLEPSGQCAAFEAEALYELGKTGEAKEAAKRISKDTPAEYGERVVKRQELNTARTALKNKRSPANLLAVARVILELDEPWRMDELFTEKQVVAAAHPGLDEAYIQAALGFGLDYKKAWAFGKKARGTPPAPGFLARRIGAGLMLIMGQFYSGSGRARMDRDILAAIEKDLKLFRKSDARLADLTSLYLAFIGFVTADMTDPVARKQLSGQVERFSRAYPRDLAGVQMVYLLAQLGTVKVDPWEVINRYRGAMRGKEIPAGFLPVYAGAAMRLAMKTRDQASLGAAVTFIDGLLKKEKTLEAMLWRAHLLAVGALMSPEATMAGELQLAVNAYGEVIAFWSDLPDEEKNPQALCDAVISVGSLVMQAGAIPEVRSLFDQTLPVCSTYPETVAFGAVIDLAEGKKTEGGLDPIEALTRVRQLLASHQAQAQTLLWLATAAEAGGDKKAAEQHMEAAAKIIGEQRSRGAPAVLAPDLRSLVAFSGTFNMGVGYSDQSPFGLVIEVTVQTRMNLFPPAAVDEKKLAPFLPASGK